MKLKEWFRARKQRREERRKQRLERKHGAQEAPVLRQAEVDASPELQQLGADTAGIVELETRMTEEYKEFLKAQESAREKGQRTIEEM